MLNKSLDSNSTPRFIFKSILDITPHELKSMGAEAVGIDIDNTTAFDSSLIPIKGVKQWVERVREAGIPVIIVTNTYIKRAEYFAEKFGGLPYVGNADKPKTDGFIKAAETLGVDISRFAMIGDQLFTDIQGANAAGAIPILVKYKCREIFVGIRYLFIRHSETKYLEHHGLSR